MIMNLFSIFDPSIYFLRIFPWLFLFITLLIILINYYFNNKMVFIKKILLKFILNEVVPLLGYRNKKGITSYFLIIFFSILLINFFSLFPFHFTVSAHIIMAFPSALIIWLIIIIFGLFNNSKMIIIHIVPIGTPLVLINFIVLIELVRNFIRPITLSVRLTANMVAGHLLLRLLGGFGLINELNFGISFLGILILSMLELSVSFIQSYVFITLITLYSTEIL